MGKLVLTYSSLFCGANNTASVGRKLLICLAAGLLFGISCGILSLHHSINMDWKDSIEARVPLESLSMTTNRQIEPPQRGIVLSSQCSGSTWFCLKLNGNAQVVWGGEEMVKYSTLSNTEWKTTTWDVYLQDLERSFETVEANVAKVSSPGSISLIGFKLMYDQIPDHLYKPFADWLNDNDIVVLHLVRKASVLRYASGEEKRLRILRGGHARYRDEAELRRYNGGNLTSASSVELNAHALEVIRRHEHHMEDFATYIRAHAPFAPYMEVAYESLTGLHEERVFRSIGGFLGVQGLSANKGRTLLRTNPGTCSDRVMNLGDQFDELHGTRSKLECRLMEAAHDPSSRKSMTDLLPPSTGQKCRFVFNC